MDGVTVASRKRPRNGMAENQNCLERDMSRSGMEATARPPMRSQHPDYSRVVAKGISSGRP
jgi:hypothetical protein